MRVFMQEILSASPMWRPIAVLAICVCSVFSAAEALAQPVIRSVFPSAARTGATVTVEFRGTELDGVYAVWVDSPGVTGEIRPPESIDEASSGSSPALESDAKPGQTIGPLVVELRVDAAARLGTHGIRLVSPRGLSNAVSFFVADQPVEIEAGHSHDTLGKAQATQVPALINGRLEQSGQVDCYAFAAEEGEELRFEVIQTQELRPRLALLGPATSWFNAERPERHLFQEQRKSDLVRTDARRTFRVPRAGRYAIQVSSLFGQGSVDATYLLAVSRADEGLPRVAPPSTEWIERSFVREIGDNWLRALQARSFSTRESPAVSHVAEPAVAVEAAAGTAPEKATATATATEPSESAAAVSVQPAVAADSQRGDGQQAPRIAVPAILTLPAILQGVIGRPGEIDRYRFTVRAGEEVAVEIETPEAQLPAFNPWVAILDSENREVFSNLHRKVSLFNNNAERQVFIEAVMPRMVHRFEKPGEYTLQVRDITAHYGDPTYRYRIFVRPQVPHVGEISLGGVDRLNLERGRAGRVTLTTTCEEGFAGSVAFLFSGLPTGVQALPADVRIERKAETQITENPQTVLAPTTETTLVLAVSADAPLTHMPQVVRVECRALEQGQLGPPLLVRELPVMIVGERENKEPAPGR